MKITVSHFFVTVPSRHFSISEQSQPNMITEGFKISLKELLVLHLRVADNPKFGTRMYITPFDSCVTMKVRRLLSTVEGHYVFDLHYFELLELFKIYCQFFFPIHFYKRFMGIEYIGYLDSIL